MVFTQPIVVTHTDKNAPEIVDGFHRHEIGKGSSSLKLRLKGYLPVTCLEGTRNQRIAATIRHNRARGRHQITAMSEIVRELSQLGWDDNKIGKELGMDSDEVLRLKQINGLQELFADRQYSRALDCQITTAGAVVQLLPATSIPSWQNRDESVYEGRDRRKTPIAESPLRRAPCVSHWQNSTSSGVDTAL